MTRDHIATTVVQLLRSIAPEADFDAIDPDEELREELDIDSMDFLNFVTALCEKLGIDIPETDYSKLTTLSSCISYLASRSDAATPHEGGPRG